MPAGEMGLWMWRCGAEPGINPEGRCVGLTFLFHAGEEEDGDEDDEAEGATGKRAAEDDEVGRMAIPLEPPVSSEGLGRASAGPERPGWALGLERPAHAFPFLCLSRDTSHFHLYPGLVRRGCLLWLCRATGPGLGSPRVLRAGWGGGSRAGYKRGFCTRRGNTCVVLLPLSLGWERGPETVSCIAARLGVALARPPSSPAPRPLS